MKVLHVISQTPDFTGSGKYVLEMIRQSGSRGNENFLVAGTEHDFRLPTTVLPPENCCFVRFGHDLDFPIVGMSDVMPYSSTVCSSLTPQQIESYKNAFRREIGRAVTSFKPDVVHTNHLWMASAVTREVAPRLPMVTTCHGTCLRQHRLCPELGRSLKGSLSGIDRIIALSEDQKQAVCGLLDYPEDRVSVISGGFNSSCFHHDCTKRRSAEVRLLYAGKLGASKGVPWLLKSLTRLKNRKFHLHLVGGGSGAEKRLCLELAAELGDKVTVHGILSHRELADLMRESDIFVLPSFYEGVPLVLLEALACGCRIITTDLPGSRMLFTPAHPSMVRMVKLPALMTVDRPYPEDEPALESKLAETLAEAFEDILGGAGPDLDYIQSVSKPYTWEKIFDRVDRVYREAADTRR
ncbi:glycosyltransferase family 4 protein [Maridesulfovibrio sp.]|uniref:glycosyltransferase family 4 protein n=1 Tax=Maridesulfovibrio sp. TaxID=2795000 RepID=UPI002A18C0AA|nr:glycosyltransferase family 4 protein [Maridesulfovibrio sp.]